MKFVLWCRANDNIDVLINKLSELIVQHITILKSYTNRCPRKFILGSFTEINPLASYLSVPFQSLYTIGVTGLAMAAPLFGPLQKKCKSCSQTLPTPVRIAFSSTRGGGFGDICHVSVFSTGIHAEPIELQSCNYTIGGYQTPNMCKANRWFRLIQSVEIPAAMEGAGRQQDFKYSRINTNSTKP